MPIKLMLTTALANLILQSPLPPNVPDWITQLKDVGTTGLLMLGIVMIWRTWQASSAAKDALIQAKDAQILESTRAITAALTASTASTTEMRGILAESVKANQALRESIERLTVTIQRNGNGNVK